MSDHERHEWVPPGLGHGIVVKSGRTWEDDSAFACETQVLISTLDIYEEEILNLARQLAELRERHERLRKAAHRYHHRFCDADSDEHEQAVRWAELDAALAADGGE